LYCGEEETSTQERDGGGGGGGFGSTLELTGYIDT
jgi:hypothetical protein